MKQYIWTASVLAAGALTAMPAHAQMTGHASASAGQIRLDNGGASSASISGFDASMSSPVGGLTLQTNLSYDDLATGVEANVGASANLGVRNSNWAAAGYLALRNSGPIEDTAAIIGAEGLYYMNNFTFSLGAGAGKFFNDGEEVVGVEGEARYFVNDNMRVDLGLGHHKLDDGTTDTDGPSLNLGAEWRYDNQPFSVFTEIAGQRLDTGGPTDSAVYTMSVGVRYDFATGTLKARERTGAGFRPVAGFDSVPGIVF